MLLANSSPCVFLWPLFSLFSCSACSVIWLVQLYIVFLLLHTTSSFSFDLKSKFKYQSLNFQFRSIWKPNLRYVPYEFDPNSSSCRSLSSNFEDQIELEVNYFMVVLVDFIGLNSKDTRHPARSEKLQQPASAVPKVSRRGS